MRVLLVEDEAPLARTLRRGLVAGGFVVDTRHDGVTGLHAVEDAPYDVIVLDIMLPGPNGYDVCRRLREANIWTPILMLTAKDGEYDEVDAFDLGADDYLTKPFSFAVLVTRLRSLIRRGAPERPASLAAGDLTLDPSTRVVQRAGVDISLTPREFGPLHYLMRHRGVVMSRLEILESVWDLLSRDSGQPPPGFHCAWAEGLPQRPCSCRGAGATDHGAAGLLRRRRSTCSMSS